MADIKKLAPADVEIKIQKDSDDEKKPQNTLVPISPKAPVPLQEEKLGTLLLALVFKTKVGFIVGAILFIFLLTQIVSQGTFGARTMIFLGLLMYLCFVIYQEFSRTLEKDEIRNLSLIKFLLIPTLIIGYFEITFLWKQHAATILTREISGNENAFAECQRFMPALFADSLNAGYYAPSVNSNRAVIQFIYCNEWGNFYFSNKNTIEDTQTLWALGTVIHEAIHVAGENNEAVTQCLTNMAFPNVLRDFGVYEYKIQEYMNKYIPLTKKMPSEYLNGDCTNHPFLKRVPHIFESAKKT